MTYNPFKSIGGFILKVYFNHIETKAFEETESEPHFAILSWNLGETWYFNIQRDAQTYAFNKDRIYGNKYHRFYVESYIFVNMIVTKINKILDIICMV